MLAVVKFVVRALVTAEYTLMEVLGIPRLPEREQEPKR